MDPNKAINILKKKKQQKEEAKKLFDEFHDNLGHYLKMHIEIKDLKNDPKNLDDEEYIKKLDEKLNCQFLITKQLFCNLELLLDKSWYEKNTIKSWIKKWMSKYKDDQIYTKNMRIFIIFECRDIVDYFPEIFLIP